jgi:hypothetical protein
MKFSIYNNFGAGNSAPVFAAFEQGLTRLGHTVTHHDNSADVAVIWSQLWAGTMQQNLPVWQLYRNSNRPVVVLEVGAINRGHTWKILPNGVNRIVLSGNSSSRSQQLGINSLPWTNSGEHVLIALQRPESNQWHGQPQMQSWLNTVVDEIQQHTDRPIVIRKHPRFRAVTIPSGCSEQLPTKIANTYDTFDFDQSLRNAWAVVNWNSNPGINAVLNGVPAFVGPSSIAVSVANTSFDNLDNPARPDRTQWINDLAWTEWTTHEIATGEPVAIYLSEIND